MGDVAGEGRTILFVSHNMGAIQQICTKSILMDSGKNDYLGDSLAVVKRYMSFNEPKIDARVNNYFAKNGFAQFQLSDIRFTDSIGSSRSVYMCGENININLDIESETTFRNLIVTIGINDENGTRLTVLHSDLSGASLQVVSPHTIVTCSIPNLVLLPGKYFLDIKIYHGRDVLLWIPNAKTITVEPGNILKSGKLPPKEWGGYFVLDNEWNVIVK
jgi:lipopolysaccharide transport system ATP-binding protein